MKYTLFLVLYPIFLLGQVQIGDDILYGGTYNTPISTLSLSSNGQVVAFSSKNANNTGEVKVYKKANNNWEQVGQVLIGDGGEFGTSMSLSYDGNIIAISAPRNYGTNGHNSGRVKVYQNINDQWTQIGQNIDGENSGDFSGGFEKGISLSADGSIIAIGAYNNDDNAYRSGHVRVFKNINNNWIQIGQDIDGKKSMNQLGRHVSLSANGKIIAISGLEWDDTTSTYNRFVSIYKNKNNFWTKLGNNIKVDLLGMDINLSADGSVLAILEGESSWNNPNYNRGQVKVYKQKNDQWKQIGNKIDGETWGSLFGGSVSLSDNGDILAVGIPRGAENGHIQTFINSGSDWSHVGTIAGDIILDRFGDSKLFGFGRYTGLSADGNTLAVNGGYDWDNSSTDGFVKVFDLSAMILVTKNQEDSAVGIYPNPASDKFTIKLNNDEPIQIVNIYNNLGQLIYKTNNKEIRTTSWSKGLYFSEIITNNSRTTKKVMIK